MKNIIYLFLSLCLFGTLKAQVNVKSATVSADSVKFSINAPSASSVNVVSWGTSPGTISDTTDLVKNGNNWLITLKSVPEGFYYYQFHVNGAPVYDPLMHNYYCGKHTWINAFEIRSTTDTFDLRKNGPFGNFNICPYKSKITGEYRNCVVYTPAGYDDNPSRKYPVLYLLSDIAEDKSAWMYQGKINDIMDNAITAGKIKPIIVVMEDLELVAKEGSLIAGSEVLDSLFITDLVPFIDSRFHTIDSAKCRAIAGCMAGSSKASDIFLKHNDKFHNLGIFSFSPGYDAENFNPVSFSGLETDLIFIGAGTNDATFPDINSFHNDLTTASVSHVFEIQDGNFNWLVWRKNLYSMIQLLFK
jgi:enterochelin esterase-like enzyme